MKIMIAFIVVVTLVLICIYNIIENYVILNDEDNEDEENNDNSDDFYKK